MITTKVMLEIFGLVIGLTILAFAVYWIFVAPTQSECWRNIQSEFSKQLMGFVGNKWGRDEFYIPAIMDDKCVKLIAFVDEEGCKKTCENEFKDNSKQRNKCLGLCDERCVEKEEAERTGHCIILIPDVRSWTDVPKLWKWMEEAPWDTMRMIYHNAVVYSAGEYTLSGPELRPRSGENQIHCLKFTKNGNSYVINEIWTSENEDEYKERCRKGETG